MEKLWTKDNFKCDRYCGDCCKKLLVGINKEDIKRIKKLGHKEDDFLMEDPFKNRLFLKKDEKGWCVFLKKDKNGKYSCSVHKNRPKICRNYPFFPETPKKIKSCLPEDIYPTALIKIKTK